MITNRFLAIGLGGQQYPRGYGNYAYNPYAGSYGGIGTSLSFDPVYSNGFGSEYGSTYANNGYNGYNGFGLGNPYVGGGGGGGFQY